MWEGVAVAHPAVDQVESVPVKRVSNFRLHFYAKIRFVNFR